ncbi:MAG: ferritin-like domain-containing protein [Gemmataceae bacterium]|nr:ferritin-like domain-containing protein [Gemmataceae bacterium]
MKLNSLRDVFVELVRDLYNAESQLVKALPKMARAASSPELKEAFAAHLEETKGQVERLDRVADALGVKPKGKTCQAMKGLVAEGAEVIEADGDPAARDAALIAAAQKVEHYEIAGYGTARTFARLLGERAAADLLEATLREEEAADEKLTAVAESGINQEAAEDEEDEPPAPARKARPAAGGKRPAARR